MINLTFPDGSCKQFEPGLTAYDVAKSLSNSLAKAAIAAKFNGQMVDLNRPLTEDGTLSIHTFQDEEGQEVFWHSSSHLMAEAVGRLFPGTKFGIGPAIKDGFYYDFDSPHTFTPEDLPKITAEMQAIAGAKNQYQRQELSRAEALELFKSRGEIYKVELIEGLPEDAVISIYRQGDFFDLCAGPHLTSTEPVKAIALLSIAGAYWRGSEKNKMLQRIYGISFPKKDELESYLNRLEEAKKRDHRKLGAELDLFTIMEEGPGFPFFLPKGMVLRNELEAYWHQIHAAAGYVEIKSPIILNRALWEQSGHWDHYKDNMYFTQIDEADYAVKPMNCPGSILVYRHKSHSYRDLPMRVGELGLVHRHEKSGVLHGLMRVRCFTQDDAHIYMLQSQVKDEVKGVVQLIDQVYKMFGFSYHVELSTKPEKAMGSDEVWQMATTALEESMQEMGLPYKINPGDGAFYGPKLDFKLQDSIGRTWQCGTIQLDFQMPERFDLTYIGEDGNRHRPVMIHRVVFGSIERFIGILTEHYAGAFPIWLAPVQVKILNITDKQQAYAEKVLAACQAAGLRAEFDARNEKIGFKIREAQNQKVPYMLVVGEKEAEAGTVAVRKRGAGDIGAMALAEIIAQMQTEVKDKL